MRDVGTALRPVSLRLSLAPDAGLGEDLRRFVERAVAAAGLAEGRDAELATAAYELFQNAARAGPGAPVDLAITVAPQADRVTIAVRNACDAAQYDALRARLDRLNADPDALHAYVETIRRTPHDVRGGIGLPRVRYESALSLQARHDGRRVTLVAQGSLRPTCGSTNEFPHA